MERKKAVLSKEGHRAKKKARREAARLRNIQRDIQAKQDQLNRETAATETNSVVIKSKWRDIMRRLCAPQLYDDFVTLRLRTERLMDLKSALIEDLREALDQANDQYNRNLQHHADVIDRMLDIFHDQMEAASGRYRCTLGAMRDGLAAIPEDHDTKRLEVILFAMQETDGVAQQRLAQRRAETAAKMDEEDIKHAEEFQVMQTRLESALERQWSELRLVLEEHRERHAERRVAVERLRAKEQTEYTVIATQRRRTRLLHRQIEEGVELVRAWDTSDPAASDRSGELRALRHERDEFRSAHIALRDVMDAQRQHDRQQLRHLVVEAEESLKLLKETASRGQKILTLWCLCNSLETDARRVDFPKDIVLQTVRGQPGQAKDPDDSRSAQTAGPSEGSHTCFTYVDEDVADDVDDDGEEEGASTGKGGTRAEKGILDESEEADLMTEVSACLSRLDAFWTRAGLAEVDRQRAGEEVLRLREENQLLRVELREYLRCVAPTWWGSEPVPRGAPSLPLYAPSHRPRGTTPWRGIRAVGI